MRRTAVKGGGRTLTSTSLMDRFGSTYVLSELEVIMFRCAAPALLTLFALQLPFVLGLERTTAASPPGKAVVTAQPTTSVPAAKPHAIGDPLFIEWRGSWWKATTLATLPDGRTVIHYDGWSDDYDEIAKPKRIRQAAPGAATYAVGEAVFVEWQGSWWGAKILSVPAKGKYRVRYDGYGAEWDEDAPSTRVTRLTPPEG